MSHLRPPRGLRRLRTPRRAQLRHVPESQALREVPPVTTGGPDVEAAVGEDPSVVVVEVAQDRPAAALVTAVVGGEALREVRVESDPERGRLPLLSSPIF